MARITGRGVRHLYVLLLVIASFCFEAKATDLVGLDVLGLARSDVAMITQEWPTGYALGALDGTFGPVRPSLERVLATGRVPAFRVHLVNWTCRRNNNCEPGEPSPANYIRVIAERAKLFEPLAKKAACYLSPVLEYDEQDRAKVQAWVDAVKRSAPSCRVVLSPFRGVTVPGPLIERHGNEAKADIISNDGESLFDANTSIYPGQAKIIAFGWLHRFNCRTTGEKVFTAPTKRSQGACATREDLRQAARVLRPEAPKPKGGPKVCASVRELKDRELWKTNAEDYNNGDVRGNRPLLITQSRSPQMDLLAPDGRKVGCLRYYGPYDGSSGYHRHYAGSCSGDAAVSLQDKAGNEWIYAKDGGQCILVNSIRRKGYYR